MKPALGVLGDVVRNRGLRRLVIAFAAFVLTEYAAWIGVLVYAYRHGGATSSGLLALALLVPAAVIAPLATPLADRLAPAKVVVACYALQSLGYACAGAAILVGANPLLVYVFAIVGASSLSTVRPSQVVLVPALTREVKELTATNALVGWVESLGILLAGLCVGLALTFGNVGHVYLFCSSLLVIAVILVVPLRTAAPGSGEVSTGAFADVGAGLTEVWRAPQARLLVGLLVAEYVVLGALDVLFVVLALDLLHVGDEWAGYLNTACGLGGVILGSLGVFLVGRRLGPVIMAMAALTGFALAATALTSATSVVVVLLVVVGGGHTLFEVGTRALLQRAVASHMVGRIFGLAEGLGSAGCAAGSVLVPVLIALWGERITLVAVGLILPLYVAARAVLLLRIDQHARVPIVEISLLRSLRLFRALPAPALEGLAGALERTEYQEGKTIVREGEKGNRYYAIVDGRVEVSQGGDPIAILERGDGFGEMALLGDGRRTATAVAASPVTAFALDRESFLIAINSHGATRQTAAETVSEVQARDAGRPRRRPRG